MSQDVDLAVAILRAAGAQVERTVRPRCRLVRETRGTFTGTYQEWSLEKWDAPAWEVTVGDRSVVVEDPAMSELARTEAPRRNIAAPPAGQQLALGGDA